MGSDAAWGRPARMAGGIDVVKWSENLVYLSYWNVYAYSTKKNLYFYFGGGYVVGMAHGTTNKPPRGQEATMTKYVVRVSSAHMPNSCWGKYVHVAVMEMMPASPFPRMISVRARGCVRIVRAWYRCHSGGSRSAAARAIKQAKEMVVDHWIANRAMTEADACAGV